MFPEVEVNYWVSLTLTYAGATEWRLTLAQMYPAKMLPGCRVFVKTSATSDRQARLLLQSFGVPFYGPVRN